MQLYELAKSAMAASQACQDATEFKGTIVGEAVSEFANAAGINIRNNAFGIMLAYTSAKLIVQAVEERNNT